MPSVITSIRSAKRCIVDSKQTLCYLLQCNRQPTFITEYNQHIHYICHGNICRSAFAEKYSSLFAKANGIDMLFSSSGLGADQAGHSPHEAVQAAHHFKVDLTKHVPLKTSSEFLSKTDLIIGMHTTHFFRFRQTFPHYSSTFYLLKHLVFPKYWQFNIHDPFNQSQEFYHQCFNEIKICIDILLAKFSLNLGN